MAADAAALAPSKPPFWRNVRVLRVLGQVAFVLGLVLILRELFLNLRFGLERQGLDLEWEFLRQRAGFDLKETWFIRYSPNASYWRAIQVGVFNTIRASLIGITLGTLLGLVIGVARLSPNWIVRKVSQLYVELFRNTPALVQVIFWYQAVFLLLPSIGEGTSLWGLFFFSNRAVAIPWLRGEQAAGIFLLIVIGGLAAAWAVGRWRRRVNERTGEPARTFRWRAGVFLAVATIAFFATGTPLGTNVPELAGRRYEGGIQLSPEFAALLVALTIYTAAFIAEIIRGSILAVTKGQKEAAAALGLSPAQQLRLVVLPQALRTAVPPINSQYQNLTKNTSLAIAIAYPEMLFVARTIANQAGRATQVLLIAMGSYLILTLTISVLMNVLNRGVALRGEG